MTRIAATFLAASSLGWTACSAPADTHRGAAYDDAESASATPTEATGNATRHADGSLRVPFLGGAFVTYATEMPVEVEQAVAGQPTERKVIVWAGLH